MYFNVDDDGAVDDGDADDDGNVVVDDDDGGDGDGDGDGDDDGDDDDDVRACAVEMHMDMSPLAFSADIYRERAKRSGYHLHWTSGLNCYRKNPSVWPYCLAKKNRIPVMMEVIWADKVIFRCGRLHPHDLWLLPIHMFYCLKISVLDIFVG